MHHSGRKTFDGPVEVCCVDSGDEGQRSFEGLRGLRITFAMGQRFCLLLTADFPRLSFGVQTGQAKQARRLSGDQAIRPSMRKRRKMETTRTALRRA